MRQIMPSHPGAPDPAPVQGPFDPDVGGQPQRLSNILQAVAEAAALPDERLSLGQLIDGFGNRAFGALLFLFAVPVALPIAIPGISAVLGAPLLFLSWQLMRGRDQPWLPEIIRSRSLQRIDFSRMLQRVLPSIRRVERMVGPRLTWMTTGPAEQVIGCLALVLAMILFLPIPFGNSIPALAIAILALAVLERDGVAAIVGTLIGAAGVFALSGLLFAILKGAFLVAKSLAGA
ncbi:exopolysaccharide biosynthesis protein [Marivita sp.]|uniref:exopolysaccharide biosynthesis protein n=1 Tax=Marivita sp. TaxID=2003365 RepID=UPI0025BDCAA1|nr:exopolysaccharide biosynthesis protein [Marivita sp.]